MNDTILNDAKSRMTKAIEALSHELGGLRTGRASISILDGIRVDYYGTPTPLSQVATLSAPEPRSITIQPWDVSQIHAIEKAIMSSDLGLNPSNDGKVIRISIPQLTEERRKELVKIARKYGEECKIAIRNIRRDANEDYKKLEKDKTISQDELKKHQQDVQDLTDKQTARVDEMLSRKEAEIMEV
jgi:ribosome recycling factor